MVMQIVVYSWGDEIQMYSTYGSQFDGFGGVISSCIFIEFNYENRCVLNVLAFIPY